jgi:nonsense-mediated mRNA decay protein 3
MCGASVVANKAAMCPTCLQAEVDITEGIERIQNISWCRGCEKFLRAPHWVDCDLESPELMTVCLRVIKGLDRVKLVDANWVWTEPHSRRLKIRLTIQKDALGVTIQQDFVVEMIMKNLFCDECHKGEAKFSATSTVQVRQHVNHKRTFLYLEQMIIRLGAAKDIAGFAPGKNGLDFEFGRPQLAARFVDFVRTVVPCKTSSSKKLVGENRNSNESNFRFKHSVLIAPICKHDLVLLPKALARMASSIPRLVVCSKVTGNLKFTCPRTGKFGVVTGREYWKQKKLTGALLSSPQLIEYIVLDCTPVDVVVGGGGGEDTAGGSPGRHGKKNKKKKKKKKRKNRATDRYDDGEEEEERQGATPAAPEAEAVSVTLSAPTKTLMRLGDVEVARARDFGVNDERFFVRSHLGAFLKAGDTVLGYDLENSNLNVDFELADLPDVVLVRKKRPPRRWRAKGAGRHGKKKKEKKKKKKSSADEVAALAAAEDDEDEDEVVEEKEVPTLNPGFSMADNDEELELVMEDMDEEGLLTPMPGRRGGVGMEMAAMGTVEAGDGAGSEEGAAKGAAKGSAGE